MSHLLAVTTTVMEHGGTPEQCMAAALHDYLEDIEGSSALELRREVRRMHEGASRMGRPRT